MTAATATNKSTTTKTREQELEELVAKHNEQLIKLNGDLERWLIDQATAQQEINRIIDASFGKPTEGLAEDLDAARQAERDGRERAEVARLRMESYLRQTGLRELEAELEKVRNDRQIAEVRAAAESRHAANLEEYFARVELVDALRLQLELEHGRCRELIMEINFGCRQYGLDAPASYDMELNKTSLAERLYREGYQRVTRDGGAGTVLDFYLATPEQLAELLRRIIATEKRLARKPTADRSI